MDTDTLEFYETNAEAYAAESLTHDVLDIRGRFIARLPKGARILDLGCGSGRDSFAFSRLGFETVPVDGSENMCREAERYTGLPVRHVRFSELDYREEFDGVWACASLLHVPSAELPHVLNMVRQALRIGGIFFCCFKEGTFEGERDGRYYTDMTSVRLKETLENCGFSVIDQWENTAFETGTRWVNAVSRRL